MGPESGRVWGQSLGPESGVWVRTCVRVWFQSLESGSQFGSEFGAESGVWVRVWVRVGRLGSESESRQSLGPESGVWVGCLGQSLGQKSLAFGVRVGVSAPKANPEMGLVQNLESGFGSGFRPGSGSEFSRQGQSFTESVG